MIRRLYVEGFKSLQQLDFSLRPLTVMIGPNAAGKSNILDALQLVSRCATSRSLKEAFESPYRGTALESLSLPKGGMEELINTESASLKLQVDVELSRAAVARVEKRIADLQRKSAAGETDAYSDDKTPVRPTHQAASQRRYVRERLLRYGVELQIRPRTGIVQVADEYAAAMNSRGEISKSRAPFLERVGDQLRLRMEKQGHPRFLDRWMDSTVLSQPLYAPHHPHLAALREELASWLFFYFEPRERMRTKNPVKEVRHLGLMGEDLAAFLNTLQALDEPQFKSVEKAMGLIIPSVTGINLEVNSVGEVQLSLLEGDTPIPASVVSEGTLRVLGMLALSGTKEPPSVLGFEEPENGIHPRRLGLIAEYLESRSHEGESQLIVTTHSPLLPDYLPPDDLFVVRRSRSGTTITPFETIGDLYRRADIEAALDDEEDWTPPSKMMIRGDLDD